MGGRAQQGTDQHGLEGCVLGVVSSDPGLSLGGPFGSPPPSPKGPAVFGSLGHHQRPVSDRWEGRRGHSALPACLTLGRTLLALPHLVSLQEASSWGGSQDSSGGPWGPQSGSPKPQLCSRKSSECPDPPRGELQLTGDAWVPGGKGPGSGEGVPQCGPGQEAGSSGTHGERIYPGGRTLRAGDGAFGKINIWVLSCFLAWRLSLIPKCQGLP